MIKSQKTGKYSSDENFELDAFAISSKPKSDQLEEIPYVKYVLSYCLCHNCKTEGDKEECVKGWCNSLKDATAPNWVRKMVVYVLWKSGFHNYEMKKMLNVSLRTIGRDLDEIKDEMDPFFRIRGMTLDDISKKYSKKLQPYIDDFWNRTLNHS